MDNDNVLVSAYVAHLPDPNTRNWSPWISLPNTIQRVDERVIDLAATIPAPAVSCPMGANIDVHFLGCQLTARAFYMILNRPLNFLHVF